MRTIASLVVTVVLLAIQAHAARMSYVLNSGKLALSTVDGSSRISKKFSTTADYSKNSSPFDLSVPTQLENDDVIRVSFNIAVDGKEGLANEDVPHQAFVLLSAQGNEPASQAYPLAVKPSTGKVSWNLRTDRIPASLLKASSPLTLSLLIGNFPVNSAPEGMYAPLSLALVSLTPPAPLAEAAASSLTPRQQAEKQQGFHGLPEHRHTFGIPPTETMPSTKLSGLAALVTATVPWALLVGALGVLKPELQSPSSKALVLFAALAGLEGLAVWYWVRLTLFQMLPFLLGGGAVTIVVGRSALGELRKKRLAASS